MQMKPGAPASGLYVDAEPISRLKKWNLNGSQKAHSHWLCSSRVDGSTPRGIVQKFCPK